MFLLFIRIQMRQELGWITQWVLQSVQRVTLYPFTLVSPGKKFKKPQEKQQRRVPSPRTDGHVIDVQLNKTKKHLKKEKN